MRRSRTAAICAGVLGRAHASCRLVDGCHDASAEGGCAHESQIYWAAQSAEQRSSLAQYNRINDQSILVDEAGANEALGEQSASVRKDEVARLFLQSENFFCEITACHRGFCPGLQDRRRRRDALPRSNVICSRIGECLRRLIQLCTVFDPFPRKDDLWNVVHCLGKRGVRKGPERRDPVANTPETHAVLWSDGQINDLGTLGGTQSLGDGVNDTGQVTGFAQNAIPDPFSIAGLGTQTRAFLWRNGVMQDLDTLGGPDAFAQYVNNNGQVAGVSYTSYTPDPNTGLPPLHPFLWQNGTMKDLGNFGGTNDLLGPFIYGLNRRGEVIGNMALAGDQTAHAFLWDGEKLIDLNAGGGLGGTYSQPSALNDAGEVVGLATLPGDQTQHAFLWRNGVMTDLGTLHGDPCSTADSINSSGQVVGASQSAAGGCNFYTGAFLWENGGPSVDLNTLVTSDSGFLLLGGGWINDRGEIAGGGVPSDCGDGDLCGRAVLLIPCDANHPNIAGCDYTLVDAATAAALSQQPVAADRAAASQNELSSANTKTLIQSLMKKHRRWPVHAPRP
jgi:probable HAF family extracellular repeat protein